MKGLYILDKQYQDLIYPDEIKMQISKHVDILALPLTEEEAIKDSANLLECEVIFSGWGCITFDEVMLDMMPNLKAVFYGSGSIKGLTSSEFWRRDILITSAYGANAVPVVEYTLSQILFGLKDGYRLSKELTEQKKTFDRANHFVHGCYGTTVGIISLGMIGRLVCEFLKNFDMNVIAYDPFVGDDIFKSLGVTKVDTLDEIFEKSDAVSLHTPWLPQTEGMIKGKHFDMMKEHAIFINTSRGAVVNEEEMISVLKKRQDLFAILDVTHPEPPLKNSPLYTMPNVKLTPHIAGTMNKECARMGQYMVDELERWIAGEPLKYSIDEEKEKLMA